MSDSKRPRKMCGGRSERYEERRAQRGAQRAIAPGWSDAAAAAVLAALHATCTQHNKIVSVTKHMLLSSQAARASFVRALDLSTAERAAALELVDLHAQKCAAASGEEELKARVEVFLRPLRRRRAAHPPPQDLELPTQEVGERTFHEWLSDKPEEDRLRPIARSERTVSGVDSWPLSWLAGETGVVCYERVAARVQRERGGRADAGFARGLVKTAVLPTAVANASDHYALVTRDGVERYMSVNEVARAFGVAEGGTLMHALTQTKAVTANQAVTCLGRSVHVGVARAIVRELLKRGTLAAGLRYGSAYSGIDTFAEAVEIELGSEWTYEFASESDRIPREALLEAWSARGLRAASESPPLDVRGRRS